MTQIEKSLNHFFQRLGHTPGPWGISQFKEADYSIDAPDAGDSLAQGINRLEDATLLARSPAMLRTLCRTYLWMLVNIRYRGTLTLDQTLADLRNQISEATGIACQEVQDTFEQYSLWIQLNADIDEQIKEQAEKDDMMIKEELADQRDPETKVFSAMQGGTD